jgi:hypothetical protein
MGDVTQAYGQGKWTESIPKAVAHMPEGYERYHNGHEFVVRVGNLYGGLIAGRNWWKTNGKWLCGESCRGESCGRAVEARQPAARRMLRQRASCGASFGYKLGGGEEQAATRAAAARLAAARAAVAKGTLRRERWRRGKP